MFCTEAADRLKDLGCLPAAEDAVHLLAQPATHKFKAVPQVYLFMQLKVTNYSLLLFCSSM